MSPGDLGAQSKNSFGSVIQFNNSIYVPSANMISLFLEEPPGYQGHELGKSSEVAEEHAHKSHVISHESESVTSKLEEQLGEDYLHESLLR